MAYRKIAQCLMVGALFASTAASASGLDHSKAEVALTKALTQSGVVIPAGGLSEACSGFRNWGQCVAALRTASRLNLPGGFPALKGLMTGPNALSIGDAVSQLNPNSGTDLQP